MDEIIVDGLRRMDRAAGFTVRAAGNVVWLARSAAAPGFTRRDRAELDAWAEGGRSFALHDGEEGPFAMLYVGDTPWSRWGVARQGGAVLLWNCVTHADLGRFACMADALAALPVRPAARRACNVLDFDGGRRPAL